MKIKICGITTLEDALAAIDAGADLLGFNFYPRSPRFIGEEACARMVHELRRRSLAVKLVGVFVNSDPDWVNRVMRNCSLDLAQLSGDETPDVMRSIGERAFKALRLSSREQLYQDLETFSQPISPPALLIDAYQTGKYGGTGHTADWALAAEVASRVPVLLAGGLNPANVAAAIRQVHPWGVDVASGVESAPGRKDAGKVADFIRAAQSVKEVI